MSRKLVRERHCCFSETIWWHWKLTLGQSATFLAMSNHQSAQPV